MLFGIDIIQLITAFAAIFALIFSYQASRKSNYINTITSERIKWLNNLKDLVAEFVSDCYGNDLEVIKLVKLHKIILLHLNPKEDENIIEILNKMVTLKLKSHEELKMSHGVDDDSKIYMELLEVSHELINHIQAKCKLEWERIKKETGYMGKLSKYEKNAMEINELAQTYREIYCRTMK